jgi:hypothetical protein
LDLDSKAIVVVNYHFDFDLNPSNEFWKLLDKSSISANKFLIMGLGDKYYPHFAYAVVFLVENILKYNGIVLDYLKIQENWENNQKEIYYWINNLQF